MNRKLITTIATVIIVLAMFMTYGIFAQAAKPKMEDTAERIISQKLKEIGVEDGTVAGFYIWSFEKITDCMAEMDAAMESAVGGDHNLADLFQDAVSEFEDVQTEEEAYEKLYN